MRSLSNIRDSNSMDKWTRPALRKDIENLESLVAFFKNPFLKTPVREMDLEPQTLQYLQRQPFIYFGIHLLAHHHSKHLPEDIHEEITSLLQRNGFDLSEQSAEPTTVGNLKQDLRFSSERSLETEIDTITEALESQLKILKVFREREWERTHIIRVDLPPSVWETYDRDIIVDTTSKVVHQEFASALQKEMLCPQANKVSWLDKLRTLFNNAHTPTKEPSPFSVEIAVRENRDVFPEAISPVFKRIATGLSSDILTRAICDRLESSHQETSVAPEPEDARVPALH